MGFFNAPLPRSGNPQYHEASALRPARDSDAVARAWSKDQELSSKVERHEQMLTQVQRALQRMRRRILGGGSSAPSEGNGDPVWLP